MRFLSRLLSALFVLALLVQPFTASLASVNQQDDLAHQQAVALLQTLTPRERVGQLFLVTFTGTDASESSQIYDLIYNHHVGGVILQASNDNIIGGDQQAIQLLSLTRELQSNRWSSSRQSHLDPVTGDNYTPAFIPLFVGVSQEGDGYPYDQILESMTPLPNNMAIGATWNSDLATQVGNVVGQELSMLGINFLLGPSLDILESPHADGNSDLSTRTFGGDPFWVAKMGRSYVRGVHQGSSGRVAVVAKHFPGFGGSDRLPEEEVATVRKSLEQLKNFELTPFFAVTGNATTPEDTADGLLAAHIRYQGFQGNIRATTRPVSFDPQAFNLLLTLPQIDAWRNNGGIMVSDNLGSRAVRRFYELTSQTFDARRVALNAFLAGNDLLYIADFSADSDPDSFTSAVRTLDFFTQKYREDTAFAQRVDESVVRILTLKYRQYGDFALDTILPSYGNLGKVGQSSQVTFEVARQSATLISPTQIELDDTVPDPPNLNDRIVFISDTRLAQQCSTCEAKALIDQEALEGVVLRRYGPQAGGLVSPNNLSSYSLDELAEMLAAPGGETTLEGDLTRANWIVFAMLNRREGLASFTVLEQFLAERPDLFQQKRLIVFAFNAPFYLDATNISKLTAYYGLYSKASQFLDVASYLLFRELRPNGTLPVSVPGISYDLNASLFPDPDQLIPLQLDMPVTPITSVVTTTTPAPLPEFRVGDVIPVRTGVILDHNGKPVPDGTPVEFVVSIGGQAGSNQSINAVDGIARTTILATGAGVLEIQAESEPAKSAVLRFDIPAPPNGTVIETSTPEPTSTATTPPTATATPEPVESQLQPPPRRPQFSDWIIAVLIAAGIAWSIYQLSIMIGQIRWGVRAAFLALIGGLLAYSYLALEMPGSSELLNGSISRTVFLVTLAGAGVGLGAAWIWRSIKNKTREN